MDEFLSRSKIVDLLNDHEEAVERYNCIVDYEGLTNDIVKYVNKHTESTIKKIIDMAQKSSCSLDEFAELLLKSLNEFNLKNNVFH